MTPREELIEEAAKAMYSPTLWPVTNEVTKDHYRKHAEAALAVFEKAHAPTDDEREERRKALEAADGLVSVVTRLDGLHDHNLRVRATRAEAILRSYAHGFNRSEVPEPQGEPSDAQVGAAMHAVERYYASQGITSVADSVDYQAMRAALRAAASVNPEKPEDPV